MKHMSTPESLRERKKQQTKAALATSAYKLFKKQGYYLTSIEDITTLANFAPRTFFLHYSSKEDLLFPDADHIKANLEAVMNTRGSKPALTTLEQWIFSITDHKRSQDVEILGLRQRIIQADKSLQAREKMYLSAVEEVLAKEIAKDLSCSPRGLVPKLTAAAAIAVCTVVNDYVGLDASAKETPAHIAVAMEFLRSGLTAIEQLTSPGNIGLNNQTSI